MKIKYFIVLFAALIEYHCASLKTMKGELI